MSKSDHDSATQLNGISIGDLKAFVALAKETRLDAALDALRGDKVGSQRGLKQRIAKLEKSLSGGQYMPLFSAGKAKGSKKLTSHGKKALPHILQLLSVWERLIEECDPSRDFSTRLVVGAQFSIWDAVARRFTRHFAREFNDDVSLEISVGTRRELIEGLIAGTYDTILIYDRPERFGINELQMGNDYLVLMSTTQYKNPSEIGPGKYLYVEHGENFARYHKKRFKDLANIRNYRFSYERSGPALRYIRTEKGSAAFVPVRAALRHSSEYKPDGELNVVRNCAMLERSVYVCRRARDVEADGQEKRVLDIQAELGPNGGHDTSKSEISKKAALLFDAVWRDEIGPEIDKVMSGLIEATGEKVVKLH